MGHKIIAQWKKILLRVEIHISSILFSAMFLVLVFRISASLIAKFMIFAAEHLQSDFMLSVLGAIANWISKNSQWTGEASQWLWVWLVMLGISEAERTKANLKVDFLQTRLPKKISLYINIFLDFIYICGVVFLFFLSFQELSRSAGSYPSSLPLPLLWLYISMTFGMFFISLRIMRRTQLQICWIISNRKNYRSWV